MKRNFVRPLKILGCETKSEIMLKLEKTLGPPAESKSLLCPYLGTHVDINLYKGIIIITIIIIIIIIKTDTHQNARLMLYYFLLRKKKYSTCPSGIRTLLLSGRTL